ncbi:hypothetical protein C8J57DRAFT_1719279 [Mycena rebaudengoi]|nr:hypothetical protein C8J57DRAFT_1719279 [Mycena rebaudengoi]
MFLPFLLSLPLFLRVVAAMLNVTVDDTDSAISYTGEWERHSSGLNYGGAHAVSADPDGSATFTFTGVAIYYLSPLWPYAVSTELALDGKLGVIVNLTDPVADTTADSGSESAMYSVVWSATGLDNTTHKLIMSKPSTGKYIVTDGFIYTVNNGSSPSSSTPSQTFSATDSHQTGGVVGATATKKSNTLTIAIASAVGAAALIAAAVIAFFMLRRRQKTRPATTLLDEWGSPESYPPAPLPFVPSHQSHYSSVPTHSADMTDSTVGPLLGGYPASPGRPASRYTDRPPSKTSMSYGLPLRAMSAAYEEDDEDLASGSGSGTLSSRLAPLSSRGEKGKAPPQEEIHAPAPPAYTES